MTRRMRHVLLTVAALAVLGLGVYLFFEVRAAPATTEVPRPADKPVVVAAHPDEPDSPPPLPRDAAPPVRDARPADASTASSTPPPTLDGPAPTGTEIQKLDALMSEASKAYDGAYYDDAKTVAAKVLAIQPTNVRMLRIMVSASCIDGDSVEAQKHYLNLPVPDREQMKIRCARYGVSFNEK
ncbi:MAG: hypothetical protein JWP01_3759 [Myxococcales bacterium]|nr:hypothetical protein [Myxococcales bacterium]